jgi:hypothetical protein
LRGQDTLHIDVYDKDTFINDKIGSLEIDLQDLYAKGIFLCVIKIFSFYYNLLLLGHIDNWYNLPSRFGKSSHGQIHLILDYQPLKF